MSAATIPMQVLSRQLGDAIAGRRVRAGVFTTFTFDPAFFELQVLPLLFPDSSFSQPDKVRRAQLDDALRTVEHLAVYYDRHALAQDGEPAQLDYRRIDVGRRTGCFHPKVVLLLVDDHHDEDEPIKPVRQALIVGLLSANLTRAGWWENLECAHLDEIKDWEVDDEPCAFRADLLALILLIRKSAQEGDDQRALDRIHEFLRTRTHTDRVTRRKSRGTYHTRIFCGQQQQDLAGWLRERRLRDESLNLEVISPFFDGDGAGPLPELQDAVRPRETRVFLPTEADGAAEVSKTTYDEIAEVATWARLPGDVTGRGKSGEAKGVQPRRVHAKVYRLWRKGGPDLLVVGSPNLSSAGHSRATAGNLEAAFLVDVTDAGYPQRWWLEPVDHEAERFTDTAPAEEDGLEGAGLNLSLQYDWGKNELSYRLVRDDADKRVERFEVNQPAGPHLFSVDRPRSGRWVTCPGDAATQVRDLLASTSFLQITHKGRSWRILVREEGMAYRPSLWTELTPEEILEYWSLLTAAQRAAFIERLTQDSLEGLPPAIRDPLRSKDTLFDRYAGIYHAFGCLSRHVETAFDERREAETEARLLGAKYDSLPSLLEKTLARDDADPIVRYVTLLCAKQLRDDLFGRYRPFFKARKKGLAALDRLLAQLPDLKDALPLPDDDDREAFLDWYESAFLRPARLPGDRP